MLEVDKDWKRVMSLIRCNDTNSEKYTQHHVEYAAFSFSISSNFLIQMYSLIENQAKLKEKPAFEILIDEWYGQIFRQVIFLVE